MQWGVLKLCAVVLTVTGELEVLLASASPGERLVSAVAVPAMTLPLAWARRAPLPALAGAALALLTQAALGGVLVGSMVTTIAVLALLLYCAGRYATDGPSLAGAAGVAAMIAATRVAFDPAARPPREALLTFVAVASPLLVGRWAREQRLLQRELAARAARRERDRAQAARDAAEEERARIAADLQVAVAGGLRRIVSDAQDLQGELRTGRAAAARDRLTALAETARSALADVRRILGVLRHDGEPRRLAPPGAGRHEPPPAVQPAAAPAVAPPREGALDGVRRRIAAKPALVDRLLVTGLAAVGVIEVATAASVAASLTALAVCAPLLWRRRRPLTAAALTLAAVTLQSALVGLDSFPLGDLLAIVVATYAMGAYAAPLWGVLLIAAGSAAHAAVFYPDGVVAALLGGVVLPWTVGRVVRGNRDLTREGRRRNEEIEHSRAREERAAVTRERVRVARELHDAVAHSISVIAIQAGGAEGLVGRDPERAAQCAELIASVAEEALAELTRLTGSPRSRNGAPAPGLSQVDQLATRARAAGLAVTVAVDGESVALPAGVELAAFRIVQEALTNAVKHARAKQVSVRVRYEPRAVELEIADDGRGAGASARRHDGGGGHGLIGMRERVALYGGSLDTGASSSSGGYRVHARLPVVSA